MSSRYHPSSPCVPTQVPSSSYDEAVGSNSQAWAIQRMRTLCPRKLLRLNRLCTHRAPVEGMMLPGAPFSHWNVPVWSRGLPQLDQTPSGDQTYARWVYTFSNGASLSHALQSSTAGLWFRSVWIWTSPKSLAMPG